MINVLFSTCEIKKLKEHISEKKHNCNKEDIKGLDGLYKVLTSIENSNKNRK